MILVIILIRYSSRSEFDVGSMTEDISRIGIARMTVDIETDYN